MFILTRSTNRPGLTDPVGVGGPVQLSSFIDKLRPRDRTAIRELNPGQRAPAILCPFDGDVGFPVEVYRCPGGKTHDEGFNQAMVDAKNGDYTEFSGTKRQNRLVQTALIVAQIRKGNQ